MGPAWHEALRWPQAKGFLLNQHQVGLLKPPERIARLDAKAHDLVSAMAGFAAPAIGQTTLTGWYRPVPTSGSTPSFRSPSMTVRGFARGTRCIPST